jgi:predicted permease
MALRGGVELERDQNFLNVIARLAPGVELDQAQRSLTALAARIDGETGTNPGMGVRVEQRRAFAVRNVEGALLTFQWVVILVLALACAGVTNLMLTSAVGRRREMAIRAAMGASRRRLVRQVLLESLIPSLAGGALGVGLAAVLLRVVHILGANQLPRLDEVALDWRILLATTVAAIGCGLLCGLVPARQATRASLAETLQEGSSAVVRGRGARRTQEGLVIAQVSLTVVLLIGAGLLATTFMRLTAVSPGFDPSGVAAGHVSIRSLAGGDEQGAAAGWLERRDAFFTELRDRVRAIPDVEEAGLTWSLPFSGQGFSTRFAPAESPDLGDETPAIDGSVVDEDFFSTMRIPLFAGRTFTAADRADAPEVVILSEALARRLWPDGNAVGRRVRRGNEGHVLTVVGVVGDTRQRSLAQPVVPMFYQPLAQAPWPAELFVVARGSVPPATLVPRLRAALHQMDPSLPLTNVSVGDGLIAATVAGPRFRATVLAILGGFALLLAVVGLYGVVSLGVAERTREIGLRRALGAGDGAVVGLVVRGGLRLALAGVVLGVAAALLLTRFLASLVHGVSPTDAVTFMGAAAILLLAAAIGSAIPASRAARVDPVECLRGT